MRKKKITVLTATRAEYGLLSSVIKKLITHDEIIVEVVATGMHLSPEYGYTYREIENDGIHINKKIEILMSSDSAVGVSKSMALAIMSFAEYFEESKPDALLVLGDRYETLAVCCAAMNARIPIIHLYGGETTEGAIDEAVRHSITKMSYLHFTSTEEYRKRVIQLGEAPERVFHVGALGVENVISTDLMSLSELSESLNIQLKEPYAMVTFHPVTLEDNQVKQEVEQLLFALENFDDMQFVFTKANSDMGGKLINKMIDAFVSEHENAYAFESLGMKRYLSAINNCELVIGNSSSGLLEVPSFHIPTVNVGDRQKGRTRGETVIDCRSETNDICNAIEMARTDSFKRRCVNAENPYRKNGTSDLIVGKILEEVIFTDVCLMKPFYDLK